MKRGQGVIRDPRVESDLHPSGLPLLPLPGSEPELSAGTQASGRETTYPPGDQTPSGGMCDLPGAACGSSAVLPAFKNRVKGSTWKLILIN